MENLDKRNLIAQWVFDTRPVLLRFHLWLEDVEVHRAQSEPVYDLSFTPRGITRCLALTAATTALGTRLFGDFGGGAGKDKAGLNQVKKGADAISAYVMSERLWHLTRTLPENHALMVSLGEGPVTLERTLPALDAVHIKPFGKSGPHSINNGVLFRSDIHKLFDTGYVTISSDYHFEVSGRIKQEFENGRDYHSMHGRPLHLPQDQLYAPRR